MTLSSAVIESILQAVYESGEAITFVSPEEHKDLRVIELGLGKDIPRTEWEGSVAVHTSTRPTSSGGRKPGNGSGRGNGNGRGYAGSNGNATGTGSSKSFRPRRRVNRPR